MMNAIRIAATVASAFALGSQATPAMADAPCDGVYRSWGRVCQGALSIRSKTIEWNSPNIVCKPSPYEVIDSRLGGDEPYAAYRLKKRSKACLIEVVEVYRFGAGRWGMRGFPSVEAYEKRDDLEWQRAADNRIPLTCDADDMPEERCNLDFARKKK
ncbi:hypothetical protein QTH90_14970 [Variovorax sp. J2P1-59]|uniref:hypothetical protein n=1 Tax=Variovorax flavidus TaxID=3053501 RepID=UPI00257791C0|nr:hypothetical protein [Variovorax sp. J2P1-59]MDM0075703.1 hypothetical protein [Variovorax sp. J2P1-59]